MSCLPIRQGSIYGVRMRVYHRRGERYGAPCVKEKGQFGGGSVMIWAGISFTQRLRQDSWIKIWMLKDIRIWSSGLVWYHICKPIEECCLCRMVLRAILQGRQERCCRGTTSGFQTDRRVFQILTQLKICGTRCLDEFVDFLLNKTLCNYKGE